MYSGESCFNLINSIKIGWITETIQIIIFLSFKNYRES